MLLASRNPAATDALMAKLTDCGMSSVVLATFSVSSLATTTPMAMPDWSSTGPPPQALGVHISEVGLGEDDPLFTRTAAGCGCARRLSVTAGLDISCPCPRQ